MTIAEKLVRAKADLSDVFSNGRLYGYGDGMTEGIELGKQITYDDFWDSLQENGNRTNYNYSFSGKGWNNTTFKPKYNIAGTTHNSTFGNSNISGDLVELLNNRGLNLDTSQSTSVYALFNAAYYITRVGVIDTRNCANLSYTFQYANGLQTVDKVILKNDGSQTFTGTFANNVKLKNIIFEGTIGQTLYIKSAPLTVASAVNVLLHLMNYSGTSNEYTKTLTFSTTTKALLDEVQANDPNGYIPELMDDWRTYITMLGWNIG